MSDSLWPCGLQHATLAHLSLSVVQTHVHTNAVRQILPSCLPTLHISFYSLFLSLPTLFLTDRCLNPMPCWIIHWSSKKWGRLSLCTQGLTENWEKDICNDECLYPVQILTTKGAFGRWLDHESRTQMKGISALVIETPERSFIPSIMWGYSRRQTSIRQEIDPH